VQTLGRQSDIGHHRHDAGEEAEAEVQLEEPAKGMNMELWNQTGLQKAGASYRENKGMVRPGLARQMWVD